MINIRLAKVEDVEHIAQLMNQLGYPVDKDTLTARFNLFISQDGYDIAVTTDLNDIAVGWVAWSKSMLFVSDKTQIHIEGLVVDENCRGQNIGKLSMSFVEDYAKKFAPYLTSGTRRAEGGSHKFYSNLGYGNAGHMAKTYFRKEIP